MGLYQAANPFVIDADLRGFDPFRWGQPNCHPQELWYEDNQTIFKYASNARFINLNPALSASYYDSLIFQPTESWTYQRNADMILKPVLATGEPIAVGSNDTIASYIDVSSISHDSPYAGANLSTSWGPSPNIDATNCNPYKTAPEKSMFLINLRESIPWHPGWGYELGDRHVSVEDFQWTLGYLMNEDLASPDAQAIEDTYGPEPALAIEKINETMMKINLRGPLASGQLADWYAALALRPLPQHILDPAFDATPWGGGIGETPDGSTIAVYANHSEYEYNTGEKPVIGVGAYYFESWHETSQIASLKKFEHWGGFGSNNLWNDSRYSQNNIDTYAVTVYPSKEAAEMDLENGVIDGIDAQFLMGSDIDYLLTRPNIQVLLIEGGGIQTMGYNTMHPKLSSHYVRLAISHMVPAQKIVDYILGGLGSINEVVNLALRNPYYPTDEEWQTLGLSESENVRDPETGEILKFQGRIRYSIHKAWALMEKAGYDMNPFRYALAPDWDLVTYYDSHYFQNYALDGPRQWGVQPGVRISWTFQQFWFPVNSISDAVPSEKVLASNGSKSSYVTIPLTRGSLISIEIVDANQSLWGRKKVDGIEGMVECLEGIPYILPINLNWTKHWSGKECKVERDDGKVFRVTVDRDYADLWYRLEYDKTDGTLRRLELKKDVASHKVHVLLVRTDLFEDHNLDLLFIQVDTSSPAVIILAAMGAFLGGIGLAQALIKRRNSTQNGQTSIPYYLAELSRRLST
jgi:hypothetical protein